MGVRELSDVVEKKIDENDFLSRQTEGSLF